MKHANKIAIIDEEIAGTKARRKNVERMRANYERFLSIRILQVSKRQVLLQLLQDVLDEAC
jgi:hypothetical protein